MKAKQARFWIFAEPDRNYVTWVRVKIEYTPTFLNGSLNKKHLVCGLKWIPSISNLGIPHKPIATLISSCVFLTCAWPRGPSRKRGANNVYTYIYIYALCMYIDLLYTHTYAYKSLYIDMYIYIYCIYIVYIYIVYIYCIYIYIVYIYIYCIYILYIYTIYIVYIYIYIIYCIYIYILYIYIDRYV